MQSKSLKIHDLALSYQNDLVEVLLRYNDIDFMFNKHMVQYLSVDHLKDLYGVSESVINYLKENNIDNKQVLNIGTGIGLLESIGKTKNYSIDCTEMKLMTVASRKLIPELDPYWVVRNKLNSEVTYWTNSIFDDYIIYNCQRKYEYGLLVRFTALTEDCQTYNDIKTVLKNLQKYVDKIIVIDNEKKIPRFLQKYKVKKLYNNYILYKFELDNIITQN